MITFKYLGSRYGSHGSCLLRLKREVHTHQDVNQTCISSPIDPRKTKQIRLKPAKLTTQALEEIRGWEVIISTAQGTIRWSQRSLM